MPEIRLFRQYFATNTKIVNLNCTKFEGNTNLLYKEQRQVPILDFILSAGRKENKTENTLTTESSKGTF